MQSNFIVSNFNFGQVYLFRLIYDFISLYWYHIFSFFSCCSYILLALKISNQSLNIVIMRVILSNLDFPCNFSIQFNDFCYASRKYMHLREYFLLFCCLNVEMILCERMQHFYILCICLLFAGDISCRFAVHGKSVIKQMISCQF